MCSCTSLSATPIINSEESTRTQIEPSSNMFNDLHLPIAVRNSKRHCTQYPLTNFVSFNNLSTSYKTFVTKLNSIDICQEVLGDENWREAMQEEMIVLKQGNTWEIVDLPFGKKQVGCKCMFIVKYWANET